VSGREIRNTPASVRARLLKHAREQGEAFDQVLIYYAIERFLFRLSKSPWGDRLVVKGAIMLRAWGSPPNRATRDIDFLDSTRDSIAPVAVAISECLAIEYPADGLVFDPEVGTSQITVANRYPGVRAIVTGHLNRAKFKLALDIGMDDAMVPNPGWVDYPTILDMDAPRILAYKPATAIAEKFEAIVTLGMANSRMKDFYDVWFLARSMDFDGQELMSALIATFNHRGTTIPTGPPPALTAAFYDRPETQRMWSAFVSKSGSASDANLHEVVELITMFIMPAAVAAAAGRGFSRRWSPERGWHPPP
jgi:predicted nucleotidyltransferase component of viral defense system